MIFGFIQNSISLTPDLWVINIGGLTLIGYLFKRWMNRVDDDIKELKGNQLEMMIHIGITEKLSAQTDAQKNGNASGSGSKGKAFPFAIIAMILFSLFFVACGSTKPETFSGSINLPVSVDPIAESNLKARVHVEKNILATTDGRQSQTPDSTLNSGFSSIEGTLDTLINGVRLKIRFSYPPGTFDIMAVIPPKNSQGKIELVKDEPKNILPAKREPEPTPEPVKESFFDKFKTALLWCVVGAVSSLFVYLKLRGK